MKELYLSLGTNIGDKNSNIVEAINRLHSSLGERGSFDRQTAGMDTEPWGFVSSNRFLNCVAVYWVDDAVTPEEILDLCKEIEAEMGRVERVEYDDQGERVYYDRVIDIDILFVGKQRFESDRLIVPHARMKERDFVMTPLKEVVSEEIKSAFSELFD